MRALGVAICAVVTLTGSTALGAGRCATLAITDRDPLAIRGAGFVPGEKVKLLVSGQLQLSRSVRAGARGGFTTAFRVRLGRCDAVVVQAIGSRGSRAQIDVTQTACAPAP
jgi:hypothetical protein